MKEVPRRQLGKDGPMVSALGFGCMGLSFSYGSVESDEERFKVLDRAHELGATFWDTSDVYADSEDLLGKWFARTGKRSDIFLCTKFGAVPLPGKPLTIRSDPEWVKIACDKSLKRLGVDKIDLYYCHRVDLKTPIEKTVQAMAELKKEGKINHLGLSEVSAETLRRAHKVHPIAAVQLEYSPFALEMEDPKVGIIDACHELGIAIVAYSPLGRGSLTGKLKSPDEFEDGDFRKRAPKYSKENWHNNMRRADVVINLAKTKGCTPGQLSLAWVMAQGNDVIPIPGTKRIKYLEENMGALNVELTDEEAKKLRDQVEQIEVRGTRYYDSMEPYSVGDTPPLAS